MQAFVVSNDKVVELKLLGSAKGFFFWKCDGEQ